MGQSRRPVRRASQVEFGSELLDYVSPLKGSLGEAIGLVVATLLLLAFGPVLAAGLPLITGVVPLAAGLSLVVPLAARVPLSTAAPTWPRCWAWGWGLTSAPHRQLLPRAPRRWGLLAAAAGAAGGTAARLRRPHEPMRRVHGTRSWPARRARTGGRPAPRPAVAQASGCGPFTCCRRTMQRQRQGLGQQQPAWSRRFQPSAHTRHELIHRVSSFVTSSWRTICSLLVVRGILLLLAACPDSFDRYGRRLGGMLAFRRKRFVGS
jgi:hypothetical protein